MKIYLVRHGQSEMNVNRDVVNKTPDHAVPLTEEGHRQAEVAAGVLVKLQRKAEQKVRIWASPYLRTRQTAEHIKDAFYESYVEYDYREHIMLCEQQFGLFDGVSDDHLKKYFPKEWAHYDLCERYNGRFWARMPLGESRFDLAVRVHQSFGTFHRDNDKHGINTIVVVCHGATLRAFVMMWLHKSPEWFEREPNPPNAAIRLLEDGEDKGYIFEGFPK